MRPLRRERALMRGGVDAARQPAHHGQPGVGELVGKLLGALEPVVAGFARTDDADGVLIPLRQLAPDVEEDRRIIDLPQMAADTRARPG